MNLYEKKTSDLVIEASRWVGITEVGDNSGKQVEMFQRTIDDKAQKESWCLCFVQYCVREVDKSYEKENGGVNPGTVLYPTEHCLTLWNNTPKKHRITQPETGCLILWQHIKDGKQTSSGHVGIVTKILSPGKVSTVEGNTGPGKFVEREGDGVYEKERSWPTPPGSSIKFLGFLRCWKT